MGICIGGHAGSTFGGMAFDKYGFRQGTLIEFFVTCSAIGFLTLFLIWYRKNKDEKVLKCKKNIEDAQEMEPLRDMGPKSKSDLLSNVIV